MGILKFALLILALISLCACQAQPTLLPALTPAPSLTKAPPAVAITPAATKKPTATSLPKPTPTPGLIYPYTIAGLREREYPAGRIQVGEPTALSADFTRYPIGYQSDGLTISGEMQVPPGAGPFPVIVMNHGYYDFSNYRSGDGTRLVAEALNRHGYLTIAPDYRGYGQSDEGASLFHTGFVVDVMHLLKAISSLPQADPGRIGVWGHSMGGGITTKVLAIEPSVRAAVLFAPNSADDGDLIARWGYGCIPQVNILHCNPAEILTPDLPDDLLQAYQEAASNPDLRRQVAPYFHLEAIQTPIQIHIGEADGGPPETTPPVWSYKLYEALVAAGKPAELFTYPGQGHSFSGAGRELFLERIIAFYDQYLKMPEGG